MKNKTDYRLYAKELRKKLNIQIISKLLVNKIRRNQYYNLAQNVMLYYPLKNEIDLRDLLNDKKKFYLPKVSGKDLLICPYKEPLIISDYNIYEPATPPVEPDILDLIIVPALLADRNGYRLGYGGGYYDRFLPLCKKAYTITVIPKVCYVQELPHENFDFRVNEVIY